ncbi:hypothetical protein D3C75_1083250 [compost metagenome]
MKLSRFSPGANRAISKLRKRSASGPSVEGRDSTAPLMEAPSFWLANKVECMQPAQCVCLFTTTELIIPTP